MPFDEVRAVVEDRLVLVVRSTAELDPGRLVLGAPRPVLHVVELEHVGRGAKVALAIDEPAAGTVALPDLPPHGGRNVPVSLARLATRPRSIGDGRLPGQGPL